MLVSLLIIEIILFIMIILTTSMVENKFKMIERSLSLYKNTKVYKTAEHTAFIEKVLHQYKLGIKHEKVTLDLNSMIKHHLNEEYIGKFAYLSVKNIATQLKNVMWGIVILEVAVGMINGVSTVAHTIVIIVASMLLTLSANFFVIIKSINERAEALIVQIEDYIYNVYPMIEADRNKDKEISKSIQAASSINNTEKEIISFDDKKIQKSGEEYQKDLRRNVEEDRLNAQDIAELINKFS